MKKVLFLVGIGLALCTNAQQVPGVADLKSVILKHTTGLKSTDLDELILASHSVDPHNGVHHYYLNQYYRQVKIHNAVLGLHLNSNQEYLSHSSTFVSIASLEPSGTGFSGAGKAVTIALQAMNPVKGIAVDAGETRLVSTKGDRHYYQHETLCKGEITVSPVWLVQDGKLKACWNVNWLAADEQNWWNVRVGILEEQVLDYNNWVNHCEAGNFRNQSRSGYSTPVIPGEGSGAGKTNAKYKVLARPVESPSHGSMSVLNDPADSLSSPFSWHDTNGAGGHEFTITRGNNVYASEDKNNDNIAGYSPDGGSNLNFDFAFDPSKRHTDYLDAAVTNLFYWNNLMHDVWYHYGFDDASGNFQFNNYGRGGQESDEVMAEAQDGSGTNNANFATPPDGVNPRMQMFVWNVSSTSFLLRITQPSGIARPYTSVLAGFGPKLSKTPITGDLILVNDGSSAPTLGCQTFTNAAAVKNQIALIDRGTCTFLEKVQFAQNAGAKAVIVINNTTGNPITMGGTGGTGITIPSLMITKADGDQIKAAINGGQTVRGSLYDSIGAAAKQYDSDFDNGIICHEYGHGISNRLTGGPDNTDCLTNQEQMGEGWSDFFGLVMTHEPGDKGTDKRGIGTYAIDEPNQGDGIRNYPYSTSMTINPVTYNDIKTFSVPHGVGSVWCSMLWDMYWDLTDKYGFDPNIYTGKGGNNIAMKLVMDGMKLQPCNPGFTDGRDAILLADRINNKGANQDLIWKAFARRGLGKSADQGSTSSRSDGTQAFDVPKLDLPDIQKTAVTEIPLGADLVFQIQVSNPYSKTLYQIMVKDTLKNGLQFVKSTGFSKANQSGNVFTALIDSLRGGESVVGYIHSKVTTTTFTEFMDTSDFEGAVNDWKDSVITGTGTWNLSTARKYKGNNSMFSSNAASKTDRVLAKTYAKINLGDHLIFYHYYNTETDWDGGVVEILKNGQWQDAGNYMVENGYNKTISTNPNSNISGRKAFSGNSNGFIRSVIDLSAFAGEQVRVRFRFASDAAEGAEGWYLDHISLVSNYTRVTNRAYVRSASGSEAGSEAGALVLAAEKTIHVVPLVSGRFVVSPNPFQGELNIQTDLLNYSLMVHDITGRLMYSADQLSRNYRMDTAKFPSGTYVMTLVTPSGVEVYKLVK